MSAPVWSGVPLLAGLPVSWDLDSITFGTVDAAGVCWIVQESDGWYGPPAPRTSRVAKTSGAGSFRSASFRGERILTLSGTAKCPSRAAQLDALQRLAANASDPNVLYQLTVTEKATNVGQTLDVELNDKTQIKMKGQRWFDWSLQLGAPSPFKHSVDWQDRISTPPLYSGGAGLDFGTSGLPGLDFTGGLSFGDKTLSAYPTVGQVSNFGTAAAFPMFTLQGPMTTPAIVSLDQGWTLTYSSSIATGETVTINADSFPARGYPGHACLSSTRGNVRSLLNLTTDWPYVDPQATARFAVQGTGGVGALLTTSLRSAYY